MLEVQVATGVDLVEQQEEQEQVGLEAQPEQAVEEPLG